jgi:hypothetical protein
MCRANEAAFARHMAEMPELARLGGLPDVDMSLDALLACGLACWLDGLATKRSPPE